MQEKLIQECFSLQYHPVILDKNQDIVAQNYPCTILKSDISNPTECIKTCVDFVKKIGIPPSAAITVGTDFPLSVSIICQKFGLPGVPSTAAQNTSNKIKMRTVLQQNNIAQPIFIPVDNIKTIQKIDDLIQFPVVIKPADSMGARGVQKVSSIKEITEAYLEANQFSKLQQVLVESVISGLEFSLDALIFNEKVYITGIADRIISHDPYFVEIGHNLPSRAPLEIRKKIEETFIQAVKVLGISYGFAKGDIFWDLEKEQAVVGEIASRLSGGFMSSYTYPQASGINLMKNALLIALGQSNLIDLTPTKNWVSLERAIVASESGKISQIINLEKTLSLNGVSHIFLHKKIKDFVTPPRNNVEKIANILVSSPNYDFAEICMKTALETLQVIIKKSDF